MHKLGLHGEKTFYVVAYTSMRTIKIDIVEDEELAKKRHILYEIKANTIEEASKKFTVEDLTSREDKNARTGSWQTFHTF